MNNVIPFERNRAPSRGVDIVTPMIIWCVGLSLMQIATLSMLACYWDDR